MCRAGDLLFVVEGRYLSSWAEQFGLVGKEWQGEGLAVRISSTYILLASLLWFCLWLATIPTYYRLVMIVPTYHLRSRFDLFVVFSDV